MGGYGKDGKFYNDLNEQRKADNLWYQQESVRKATEAQTETMKRQQQETNNMLRYQMEQQERLEQERMDRAEELEEERRINNERLAERQLQANKSLEQQRFNNEMLLRNINLCDNAGLDYKDIEKFDFWINTLTEEQAEEYKQVARKVTEFLNTPDINNENNKLNVLAEKKGKIEANLIPEIITAKDKNKIVKKGSAGEINLSLEANKGIISATRNLLICIVIIGIVIQVIANTTIVPSIVTGSIAILLLDRIVRYRNGTKIMLKALEENDKIIEDRKSAIEALDKQIQEQTEMIDKLYDIRKKELLENKEFEDLLPIYNETIKAIDEGYRPNRAEFYNFRINHYNKDVEMLFKKLELDFGKVEKEDIIQEGTLEDYQDYMESKIV